MKLRNLILVLAGVFLLSFGFGVVGMGSSSSDLYAAQQAKPCGDPGSCYAIPDGCGFGFNCVTVTCASVACPSPNGQISTPCQYCDVN